MFFSPRIRLKPLTQLCHRLATATRAGIEDRKIWQDESRRGSRSQQQTAGHIRAELAAGKSVTDAFASAGEYYPPLFRQMVAVGEQSGQLDKTYRRLAVHYDRTLKAKRTFFSKLAWPLMQLVIAFFVIGLLIWIMGLLPINQGSDEAGFDMLGWGLVGNSGLVVYLNVLVFIGILLFLFVELARRGTSWTHRLQRLLVNIPLLGSALKTIALARFAWALQLVLDTPMDLRKALPLALNATGNDYYAQYGEDVALQIEHGQTIHKSLSVTQVFPPDMLDNIAVGEEGGRLVEVMERVSAEYQERAGTAMSVLAQIAGYAIWLLVAGVIIIMIFQLFSGYLGMLNDAQKPI